MSIAKEIQVLPVSRGGLSGLFPEQPAEIVFVGESDVQGDVLNGSVRCGKLVFCRFDLGVENIGSEGGVFLFGKNAIHLPCAYVQMVCHIREC